MKKRGKKFVFGKEIYVNCFGQIMRKKRFLIKGVTTFYKFIF